MKAHARRFAWGAQPPEPEERGLFLTGFGLAAFVFSIVFLVWSSVALSEWLYAHLGLLGAVVAGVLFLPTVVGVVRGVRADSARWRPEPRPGSVR